MSLLSWLNVRIKLKYDRYLHPGLVLHFIYMWTFLAWNDIKVLFNNKRIVVISIVHFVGQLCINLSIYATIQCKEAYIRWIKMIPANFICKCLEIEMSERKWNSFSLPTQHSNVFCFRQGPVLAEKKRFILWENTKYLHDAIRIKILSTFRNETGFRFQRIHDSIANMCY